MKLTIDAVPVVRGEWKLYGNDDDCGAPLGLAFHVARETAEQALMGMR